MLSGLAYRGDAQPPLTADASLPRPRRACGRERIQGKQEKFLRKIQKPAEQSQLLAGRLSESLQDLMSPAPPLAHLKNEGLELRDDFGQFRIQRSLTPTRDLPRQREGW